MSLYSLLAIAHAGFGCVALLSFWIAALARKGGPLHVRAGKAYLSSMAVLLALSLPMSLTILARGHAVGGAFLLYLLVVTVTSTWMSWRAVRDKRDWARYTGRVYRALMWSNLASGVGIACIGLFAATRMQLVMVGYSLIGVFLFASMRRFAAQPPTQPRWWLRQHMNAMLGNGVATHIAFLSIGLPRLLPALSGAWFQNVAWLAPVAVAALAGVWLGRKYGGAKTGVRPAGLA